MPARNHHFLSQCYLKGFSNGRSKNSRITVIDLRQKIIFETSPRNVGAIRDFNRIEIDGFDPNTIEEDYARFEAKVAPALKKIEEDYSFEGENRSLVLNFLALLAMRSPQNRENFRRLAEEISKFTMNLCLLTPERWKATITRMKMDGVDIDLSYEDAKRIFEDGDLRIEVPREHLIKIEQDGIAVILPLLNDRNWLLIKTTSDSGPFVTTDRPVILGWKKPNEIPPFYRNSPGYGLKETRVYFPISQSLALIGEFDGKSGVIEAPVELVAYLNSILMHYSYKQVFAPNMRFYFSDESGHRIEGSRTFDYIQKSEKPNDLL